MTRDDVLEKLNGCENEETAQAGVVDRLRLSQWFSRKVCHLHEAADRAAKRAAAKAGAGQGNEKNHIYIERRFPGGEGVHSTTRLLEEFTGTGQPPIPLNHPLYRGCQQPEIYGFWKVLRKSPKFL